MHAFEPNRRAFKFGVFMSTPVNSASKFPSDFLHGSSFEFIENLLTSPSGTISKFSSLPDQDDTLEELAWEGVEFTADEIEEVVNSLGQQKQEHQAAGKITKRGRWATCDLLLMSSCVKAAQGDISDRCHQIWGHVADLFERKPSDCYKRYFKSIEKNELTHQDTIIQTQISRPAFTNKDVKACIDAIKKFDLIRKDGLLDIKRLSEHVNRAYTSLRYNIYQAKNSVFCNHPFFKEIRKKYRQLHPLNH